MICLSQKPLSLYIHIPWCIKKCPYCDFNSHTINSKIHIPEEEYIDALYKDFMLQKKYLNSRKIKSIFFGGGTPSLLSARLINKLLTKLRQEVEFIENIEISLEANPGAIDIPQFEKYAECGINRISLGIQSFNEDHLSSLGRIHNTQDIYNAIDLVKNCNFNSFNLDIMYGLPKQSLADAIDDLHQALQFSPAHLSWYQLTIEPNTVFYSKPPNLPDEHTMTEIEVAAHNLIKDTGLKRYEVSAYCEHDFTCQHNLNYWKYGDYIGIGAGAHSKITYNDNVLRIEKVKQPKTYLKKDISFTSKETILNKENILFEFMLNNLRLIEDIPLNLLKQQTGLKIEHFENKFIEAVNKNFIEISKSSIIKTQLGTKYLNDLIEIFLPR